MNFIVSFAFLWILMCPCGSLYVLFVFMNFNESLWYFLSPYASVSVSMSPYTSYCVFMDSNGS